MSSSSSPPSILAEAFGDFFSASIASLSILFPEKSVFKSSSILFTSTVSFERQNGVRYDGRDSRDIDEEDDDPTAAILSSLLLARAVIEARIAEARSLEGDEVDEEEDDPTPFSVEVDKDKDTNVSASSTKALSST